MTDQNVGRLLIHHSGDAGWNMSVDQAISESASEAAARAAPTAVTLRLYTWAKPTLSLGYFQACDDSTPRYDSIDRVRRSTGGGAILHHHELTYSLSMPTPAGEHGARHDLYQSIHTAIVAALKAESITARRFSATSTLDQPPTFNADPFLCFRRRTSEDLIVSGYKVVGSAQRRLRRSVLQHGSLLLRSSEMTPELPGIFELTSIRLDALTLAPKLAERIGSELGCQFVPGELSSEESARAEQIQSERFQNPDWWSRR